MKDPTRILFFSESQTLKKIVEYSLEESPFKLDQGKNAQVRTQDYALVIFDANLFNAPHGREWELFIENAGCPVLILDSVLDHKIPFLEKISNRRLVLKKPFDKEKLVRRLTSLGLKFSEERTERIKKSEEPFDRTLAKLPADFEETLKKEAYNFLNDYCKTHFRSIAEEVLTKEIRRLSKEHDLSIEEGS